MIKSSTIYEMLQPYFGERIRMDEPLARHSAFGVGGPADSWLVLQTQQELRDLITLCTRQRWPLLLVGSGSNILYADAGVRGVVAQIATGEFYIDPGSDGTALVVTDAGVHWAQLLKGLVGPGWGGLEFAIGIPGTVGAGVISNVGAHQREISEVLEWIEILDARSCNEETEEPPTFPVLSVRRAPSDSLDLGYRHSRFREHRLTHIDEHGELVFPQRKLIEPDEIVIKLALRIERRDPAILVQQLEQYRQERKQSDPAQRHSGAIFKDPPGYSAAELITKVGLAGQQQGNAQVSERNANYIVNLGGASARDIIALITEAHQRVWKEYGVHLALNVELFGEW